MSKARQLANLLSNSADLSDGASTGGEFKFIASGAIEANKALIKKSDDTVEQIKFSTATLSSALTGSMSIDTLSASQRLLDVLLDGDYLFVVLENNTFTNLSTINLMMYSIDSNNLVTLEQSTVFNQTWPRQTGHRAWITKTSTANKYVLTIFDSDESLSDGRPTWYGIVNNLNGTFSYSGQVTTGDASSITYPKSGFRPIQIGNYVITGVTGISTSEYIYTYSLRTSDTGTGLTLISTNTAFFPNNYDDDGDPHQRIIVKGSGTSFTAFMPIDVGTIAYSSYTFSSSNGSISYNGNGTLSTSGSLSDSTYNECDIVWSDTLNHYLVLTNNATTTRVAIYDTSFNFVHARDYQNVGHNDEFYRSLQVDESTGRFYLLTHDSSTYDTAFITGTVSNNKVYFFEDETITEGYSFAGDGIPIVSLDEANGKLVYAHEVRDFTATDKVYIRFVSPASTSTTNIGNGTVIGYSKEAVSDGEYVTVAMDGGTVSLSGLTADTIYYVEEDGALGTTGTNATCVGKALTSTELRVDTQLSYIEVSPLGTVAASKVLTADSSGDVLFPDGDQIKFGTGADAQVYHNGSTFYINNNTGGTYILGDGSTTIQGSSILLETNTGENALYYDGATLYGYYNGTAKFNTTSGGLNVTGTLYSDGLSVVGTSTLNGALNITGDVNVTGEVLADSYNETYAAVTSTTNATTVDCEAGNSFSHTLTENTTFTFSNPPVSGTAYSMSIEIIQDAAASGFTVTWPTSVDWPSATAPTLTATASAVDVFVFTTRDGGTTWYGFTAGQALG